MGVLGFSGALSTFLSSIFAIDTDLFFGDRGDSAPPAGYGGDMQNIELPGAEHQFWSPAQCKQQREAVLLSVRSAVLERRLVYQAGLFWFPSPGVRSKDKGGYILYQTVLHVTFESSDAVTLERPILADERKKFWPRDIHAPMNNIFYTEEEAVKIQQLYSLADPDGDPCSEKNCEKHVQGLTEAMVHDDREGDYMDIVVSALQRAMALCHQLDLEGIMNTTANSRDVLTEILISGRQYFNWKFSKAYPGLASLAEAFRLFHSASQQLLALQHSLLALGSILALPAPEVTLKVNLRALAAQAEKTEEILQGVLTEDSNKIYMHGLLRIIYNRIRAIASDCEAIEKNPAAFQNAVAAARPAPEESQIMPTLEAASGAGGKAGTAVWNMIQLQTSLTSFVQAISSATYENCVNIQKVVEQDVLNDAANNLKRVEEMTKQALMRTDEDDKDKPKEAEEEPSALQLATPRANGRRSEMIAEADLPTG